MADDAPAPVPPPQRGLPTPAALRLLRETLDAQRRVYGVQLRALMVSMPLLEDEVRSGPSAADLRATLHALREMAGPYA